jgi:hypothetical protein
MNVLERDFFTDPELLQDPLPYYRALHERGPVVREPHQGVFMLSGIDEILEVYTDHQRFSAIIAPIGPLVTVPQPVANNAVKHGALSVMAGNVRLTWHHEADRLCLLWRESGGPMVTGPVHRGFGSTLIRESIPYELGGSVALKFAPGGVQCTIAFPFTSSASS